MAKTILGTPPSKEAIEEQERKERDWQRADILCSVILESRESSSISNIRAINYITSIAQTAMDNELISKKQAELLAGKYILSISRCTSKEGPKNGKPSGLVILAKKALPKLNINMGNPTSSSKEANTKSVFEIQSDLLQNYGIKVSPATLRDWSYSKANSN
jgi:hypothetical protein